MASSDTGVWSHSRKEENRSTAFLSNRARLEPFPDFSCFLFSSSSRCSRRRIPSSISSISTMGIPFSSVLMTGRFRSSRKAFRLPSSSSRLLRYFSMFSTDLMQHLRVRFISAALVHNISILNLACGILVRFPVLFLILPIALITASAFSCSCLTMTIR